MSTQKKFRGFTYSSNIKLVTRLYKHIICILKHTMKMGRIIKELADIITFWR